MKIFATQRHRGQTLVEFAIIIPLLVTLVVVIFDLGRAVYYSSAMHNAAREGARVGIINPNNFTEMENASINYAVGLGLNQSNVVAGAGPVECIGKVEHYTVQVIATYCFKPVTPLVEQFIPDDTDCGGRFLKLVGESIMQTETKPSATDEDYCDYVYPPPFPAP